MSAALPFKTIVLVGTLALAAVVSACGGPPPASETKAAEPAAATAPDRTMQLHHLHGIMAHGFEMALEGANLKMLGQMNMVASVDKSAVSHGEAMQSEGRALIDRALNGPAMTLLHTPAFEPDTAMTYTHDLGKAMIAVVDDVQKMPAPKPKDPKDMTMHHMHLALAHAASMASQAGALKMTAAMKMAGPTDLEAATHAEAMFTHARALYDETMKGEAMQESHKTPPAGDGMEATHALADAVNAVIDLLTKMP
jgi:hypothetical protein